MNCYDINNKKYLGTIGCIAEVGEEHEFFSNTNHPESYVCVESSADCNGFLGYFEKQF